MSKAGTALVVAASIIAAMRLAKEPNISNTPRVAAAIGDGLTLARMILDRAMRTYPELFRD